MHLMPASLSSCVWVCLQERDREREKDREKADRESICAKEYARTHFGLNIHTHTNTFVCGVMSTYV